MTRLLFVTHSPFFHVSALGSWGAKWLVAQPHNEFGGIAPGTQIGGLAPTGPKRAGVRCTTLEKNVENFLQQK
jgi:hypothetical protein